MSGQCTGWVLRHGPRDRAMRMVLLTIADAANRDGEHAHPGIEAMVEGSLYSRAHVLNTLQRLVDDQWIEIEAEGGGRGRSTVYRVLMDRSETVQPVDGLADANGPVSAEKRSSAGAETVQSSGVEVHPPHTPPSTVKLNGKSNGLARTKRATSIPESFEVTPDMRLWADANHPSVDVDKETPQFVDHHTAKGSTFKDWRAAWRTWIRNAERFAANGRPQPAKPDEPTAPRAWGAIARARARGG